MNIFVVVAVMASIVYICLESPAGESVILCRGERYHTYVYTYISMYVYCIYNCMD